jgi:SAM-dependent methyltransferase
MSTASRQRHWNEVYATKADDELSWFEASPDTSIRLIAATGSARSGPILDVGGGTSRLADRLVELGYTDVSVLDISAEAIARRRPEVHGIVADVTEWRPDRRYSVWHDRAVLHFLTEPGDRDAYRRAMLDALVPGGQAIVTTFAPSGPERCSGLPVRRYGVDELRAFLGDAFTLLESFERDHETPAGRIQRFHVGRLKLR